MLKYLLSNNKDQTLAIYTHIFCWILSIITLVFNFNLSLAITGILIGWLMWCIGVSCSLHKWFVHNSYKPKKIFEIPLLFIGTLCCLESHISWKVAHTIHHKYSGKEVDPFTGKNWKDKLRIAFYHHTPIPEIKHFKFSKSAKWFHRNYWAIILSSFLLLLLIFKTNVAYFTTIPICYVLLGYAWITSIAHTKIFGKSKYNTGDDSISHWIWELLFPGEGHHNTHHKYPSLWNNAIHKNEFDISAQIIKIIRYKRINTEKI